MPKNHRITDSIFYIAFNKKRRRKDHINIHNRTSITNSIFYISFNKKENDINVHNRASKSQKHHILASTWHSIETNKQKQKQNKTKKNNRGTESVWYLWPRRRGMGSASRRPRWGASSRSRIFWTRALRPPSTAGRSRWPRRAPPPCRNPRRRPWPPPTRTPPS